MFGPLYSTLSVQATSMTTSSQQKLVNAACQRVGNIGNSATYYAKSWQVISMMTLNGDASKIGALLRGNEPTPPPSPISSPTTQAPYTKAPTPSPTPPTNAIYCCSFDYKTCSGSSYCNGGQSECEGSCQGLWIDDSAKQCAALYQKCSPSGDCCGPATCSGSGEWMQCQPGASTSNPTPVPVPSNAPIVVTPAPSKASIIPVPTITPTSPLNNGCYSNNYKDCIPDGYSSDASCSKMWLPNGAKNNLPCGEIALEINQAVVNLLNALVMAPMLHASHLWTQLLPQHHLFFGVLLLRRAAVQRVSSAKNILTAAKRSAIKRENAGNSDLSFIIV